MARNSVRVSDKINGDDSNYKWVVRFDGIGATIGITQWSDGGQVQRILLSPAQAKELIKFISRKER